MSTKEKLIERFQALPSDFTFDELKTVMGYFGFEMITKGITPGSRIGFRKGTVLIKMHKPHPGRIVGRKTLKQIKDFVNDMQNGKLEL